MGKEKSFISCCSIAIYLNDIQIKLFMNVGVDLDEVLADIVTPLLNYYNCKYGRNVTREQVFTYGLDKVWGCSREDSIKIIHDFYNTDEFKHLLKVPGSEEGVKRLASENELFVITSRPKQVKLKTEKWIDQNFPNLFSGIYFTNEWSRNLREVIKKSDICLKLNVGVLIDDSLDYAQECASKGIDVVLLDCPWNQSDNLPLQIRRAFSWDDIY